MSTRGRTLRLGTRGSDLATRQAAGVREGLASRRYEVDLVTVETTGDQLRDERIRDLGKTGAFVRALDDEVIDGDLDAAVHSMKDVPTEMPEQLVVAAVPERASPRDVLVSPDGHGIEELPESATVGTSSLRRRAQLLAERPDLAVEPLRGNVDTRVEKLLAPALQREHERRLTAEEDDGDTPDGEFGRTVEEWFDDLADIERRALGRAVETEYDAIVLAEAGLQRIGLLHHVEGERLPPDRFVPAPGQGTLAVTALDGDLADDLRGALDHQPTRVETTVERTVLSELGGGCIAPIGIYAVLQGPVVGVTVRVLSRDGTEEIRRTRELPIESYRRAAREFAADLADLGATELIERARRETGADAPRGDGS
jgi:hydroxymethylbilane synthase